MSGTNVHDLASEREARKKSLEMGGGGNDSGGMEARVARLETRLDGIHDVLTSIRERLSRLEGKIDNLPTTWVMLTAIVGSQVALLGFTFAILRFVR